MISWKGSLFCDDVETEGKTSPVWWLFSNCLLEQKRNSVFTSVTMAASMGLWLGVRRMFLLMDFFCVRLNEMATDALSLQIDSHPPNNRSRCDQASCVCPPAFWTKTLHKKRQRSSNSWEAHTANPFHNSPAAVKKNPTSIILKINLQSIPF